MQGRIERVPLGVFLPFVMAACPEVPQAMALAYVRQACIDFCARSGLLRRVARIDMQRGVRDYPVWPDGCECIERVDAVCVQGCCYRGGRDGCGFDHGGARFTVREGLVHLSSAPQRDEAGAIEVRLTAKPARDTCEVDAVLRDDWQEAIVDGALAQLYLLPGYRWSSGPLAMARDAGFARRIRAARVRALRSDTSAMVMARAPAFV